MPTIYSIAKAMFPLATVGSFPAPVSEAIKAQAECGFHYPTTGQWVLSQMSSMETPFLMAFKGVEITDKPGLKYPLITLNTDELAVKPADEIKKLAVIHEIIEAVKRIKERRSATQYEEYLGLKATISGPSLLYSVLPGSRKSNPTRAERRRQEETMRALSDGVLAIAREALTAGASIIQIDEPYLTGIKKIDEVAIEVLRSLFSALKGLSADFLVLHVCGKFFPELFTELVKLPNLDVLDMEFGEHKDNFELVDQVALDTFDTNLAVGVVTNRDVAISMKVVEDRVRTMLDRYDPERLLIKPDCGLRRLPLQLALERLEMVQAAREFAINEVG